MRKASRRKPAESAEAITSAGAIEYLLTHKPERIQSLEIAKSSRNARIERINQRAQKLGIRVNASLHGKDDCLVRARLHRFEFTALETLLDSLADRARSVLLCLDHVQDPHNFGALARSADAFGADGIIIPKDRGVGIGAGAYHSSIGAVETIPICRVVNLSNTFEKLRKQNYWIVSCDLQGDVCAPWELPDFERVALVLGAEFRGLSRNLLNHCDKSVRIPLHGAVESLNVSVAGSVLLYEFCRRSRELLKKS